MRLTSLKRPLRIGWAALGLTSAVVMFGLATQLGARTDDADSA